MKSFLLEEDSPYVGKRLDEALFSLGSAPSRSKAQTLIKDNKAFVNEKPQKPGYILRKGDLITYLEYTEKPLEVLPENMPLNIVYEDGDVIVLNKEAGLIVHPGNGHPNGTLVNGLVYHFQGLKEIGDPIRPGLVHRIDKDTSGLLCVAKSNSAHAFLANQLLDHSMHREYMALIKGIIREDKGKIDAPLNRDKNDPLKRAVDLEKGKEAITFFEVVERYKEGYTLVRLKLLTGRTHQIRVHMAYIGFPVAGDPLYGAKGNDSFRDGQLLQAYRLTFKHPKTGKDMTFEIEMEERLRKAISLLHAI